MALKKDWMYKGILLQGCYGRISLVAHQKGVGVTFQMDIYGDEISARTPDNLLASIAYVKPIELQTSENAFAECYNYLKIREPEWVGSEDC